MNHETAGIFSNRNFEQADEPARAVVAAQRAQYKRDYMRRWRANPANRQSERTVQRRAYRLRQEMRAYARSVATRRRLPKNRCGFCKFRPSITEVTRLVPIRKATDGFVEMKIPYCGVC